MNRIGQVYPLFYCLMKQPSAGNFICILYHSQSNQVLEALTLLPYLTTTRYSFPESPTKGHWHHVNGFLMRLHATLSPRDAAPKPGGSVTGTHILLLHIHASAPLLPVRHISNQTTFYSFGSDALLSVSAGSLLSP